MSFINYASREINCKIVYYGPGLCGKTTNLQYIYAKTNPETKGKMISLATETDRTLFFDFLPLALGSTFSAAYFWSSRRRQTRAGRAAARQRLPFGKTRRALWRHQMSRVRRRRRRPQRRSLLRQIQMPKRPLRHFTGRAFSNPSINQLRRITDTAPE